MESVIFNSPLIIVLYILALILGVTGIIKKTGVILPSISVALCLLTTGYALFMGASLFETAVVLLVFLAVNLSSITGWGGDR